MKSKKLLISILIMFNLPSCVRGVFFRESTEPDQANDYILEDPQPTSNPQDDSNQGDNIDTDSTPIGPIEPSNPVQPVDPTSPKDTTVYYKITFRNYDSTKLLEVNTAKGQYPVYSGKEPTRPSSAGLKYTFAGWDPEITVASSNKDYVAKYVIGHLDVTFNVSFYMDDKTTLISSNNYKFGQMPTIPSNPVKNSTASTKYSFVGWDKEVVAVTSNAVYYAVFEEETIQYNVTFYDEDKVTVLQSGLWDYGSTPEYSNPIPKKKGTDAATYKFKGWDKEIIPVTNNQAYYAVYDSTAKSYLVSFLDDNGSLLQQKRYEYGEIPECDMPTKASTYDTVFTFSRWEPKISSVTRNEVYVAKYSSTARKYRITFYNWDKTELGYKDYEYGEEVKYEGTTPTKDSISSGGIKTNYEFIGWSKDNRKPNISDAITTFPKVIANASYYAVYKSSTSYDINLKYSSYKESKFRTVSIFDAEKHSAIKNDIIWTSNNTSVATVNKEGIVTPKNLGTAIIAATMPDGTEKRCTFDVLDVDIVQVNNNYCPRNQSPFVPWSYFFRLKNNDVLTDPFPYSATYFKVEGNIDSFNYYYDNNFYGMSISTVQTILPASCSATFLLTKSKVNFRISYDYPFTKIS